MRICLVYDSLQPYRIGGAERWYYSLATSLAEAGHDVTYVTMRQWAKGDVGRHPNAKVTAVGPWLANYNRRGGRTMLPPILFGLGVLWHLLRHGRRYDVVHTMSFPYFSVLAIAAAQPFGGYRVVVDWFELWSRAYWRRYLGPLGWVGWMIQGLCLRVRQHSFCYARLTADRLIANRVNGSVEVLTGLYVGSLEGVAQSPAEPVAVFAGRLIPEKRVLASIEAIALARQRIPELTGIIFGEGPDYAAAAALIRERGLGEVVSMAGFVDRPVLEDAMARALCLLHPSEREGYGLVVVEAAAMGVPTILAAGEDNAATELIEDGVNGLVAPTSSPGDLADAIVAIHSAGPTVRTSTAAWFTANAERLSIGSSRDRVIASYGAE